MLVHQLPPDPPGLRMRVWRRLQELGALQLKGSIYLLPASDAAREDLQWLLGEIRAVPAEASLWRARALDGLSDAELVQRFQDNAAAEYEALDGELRALRTELAEPGAPGNANREAARRLSKLRTRFLDIGRRDHFEAARREVVGALLTRLESNLQGNPMPETASKRTDFDRAAYQGRTWVTRTGVRVDRMASAWLIQRFIDTRPTFLFSGDARGSPVAGSLRFDMYAGEFTHEGELCTFEVLLRRFGLAQPGLERIGQLVHDIDLKESRYGHPETAGMAASLNAIADGVADDMARIAMAGTLLDGLLRQFARAPAG